MTQKLVIEVADQTAADLLDLAQLDEGRGGATMLNRTTLINRAVQVWAEIRRHQHRGGEVFFRDANGDFRRVTFE